MAWIKDTNAATIIFYYYTDDLFDRVNALSLYKAKNIKNQQGESMVDEYALTQGERDAFNVFMPSCATKVFGLVFKMTNAVDNAMVISGDVPIGSDSTALEDVYAMIINDRDAYNSNALDMVDKGINDMLVWLCLSDWYELNELDAQAAKALAKYNELKLDMANRRLFDLRKPLLNI